MPSHFDKIKIEKRIYMVLALFGLVLANTGCSGALEINNQYSDNIIIDASQSDWEGKLNFLEDEKMMAGFTNDSDNLYLCLISAEKDVVKRIMRTGFTIELSPENDGKKIGIIYPVRENDPPLEFLGPPAKESVGLDPERNEVMAQTFFRDHNKVQIVNEDNFPLYLLASDKTNLEFKADVKKGMFVFELKIPLKEKAKYFLDASAGDVLNVTLKTNEIKRAASLSGGDRPRGERGFGGGTPGGMMGGRGKKGPAGGSKPGLAGDAKFDVDFTVRLATSK